MQANDLAQADKTRYGVPAELKIAVFAMHPMYKVLCIVFYAIMHFIPLVHLLYAILHLI